MVDVVSGESRPLELGRVLGGGFAFVGRRWAALAVAILVAGVAPLVVETLLPPRLINYRQMSGAAVSLTSLVFFQAMRAWVMALAIGPGGERTGLGEAAGSALRAVPALLPLWALDLLPQALLWVQFVGGSHRSPGLGFGAWLLAITLVVTIGLYTPVAVAERSGASVTITRTLRLMRGSRWRLFGLALLIQVLALAATAAVNIALYSAAISLTHDIVALGRWMRLIDGTIAAVVQALWAIWLAISYRELALIHGGAPLAETADIFA